MNVLDMVKSTSIGYVSQMVVDQDRMCPRHQRPTGGVGFVLTE